MEVFDKVTVSVRKGKGLTLVEEIIIIFEGVSITSAFEKKS